MQSRRWCFTYQNYDQRSEDRLKDLADDKDVRYLIFGREKAESTGTPHLQGYIELKRPWRRNRLARTLPGVHLESARGSSDDNIVYCSKDGDVVSYGRPASESTGGIPTGFANAVDLASRGRIADVRLEEPGAFVRYGRGLSQLACHSRGRDRLGEPLVIWLWGSTGVGKSHLAHRLCRSYEFYPKDTSTWWDLYEGEQLIWIDELRSESDLSFQYLLRVLDKYPFPVQYKGGYSYLTANIFIITTLYSVEDSYTSVGEDVTQLVRRVHHQVEITADNRETVFDDLEQILGEVMPTHSDSDNTD